jgi:hypothetical protein
MVLTTVQALIVCGTAIYMPSMLTNAYLQLVHTAIMFSVGRSLLIKWRWDLVVVLVAFAARFALIEMVAVYLDPSLEPFLSGDVRGTDAMPAVLEKGGPMHWLFFATTFIYTMTWAYSWLCTAPENAEYLWLDNHGRTLMWTIGAFVALYSPASESIVENLKPVVGMLGLRNGR